MKLKSICLSASVFLLPLILSDAVRAEEVTLEKVEFSSLRQWNSDNQLDALESFLKSCESFEKMPESKDFAIGLTNVNVKKLNSVCALAQKAKSEADNVYYSDLDVVIAREFFEKNFEPYKVSCTETQKSRGMFTGYYEPLLHGSYTKSEVYKYPLYSKPDDLNENEKYYTREEIARGSLEGKGLEMLYVDNKIDLFFLQIQGSGRIQLDNGDTIKVGFAARNNRPYTSIGGVMIELSILDKEDVSAETIKKWLNENPEEVDDLLNVNESYVFFQKLDTDEIIGAQGVALTPERSLAVDKSIIPLGLPIWLETKLPSDLNEKIDYNRLLISQDTGTAIKGAVRGDVFFGHGERAEQLAYNMKEIGEYFILLPKGTNGVNIFKKFGHKRY